MMWLEQTLPPDLIYVDKALLDKDSILLKALNVCSVITVFLCVFGISTNIWNIIIFAWQGFTDTINISFFAMSVSDLLSLSFSMFVCIVTSPFLAALDIPWVLADVIFLAAGGPRDSCIRVTGMITAFLTLERCLCVALPLKVKQIITRKITILIMSAIYILMTLKLLPLYLNSYLGWAYNKQQNQSRFGRISRNNNNDVEKLPFVLSAATQIAAFVAVIICTAILVISINQSTKWRMNATSTNGGGNRNNSTRTNRTVKMVLVVAVIYIICYAPYIISFSCSYFIPDLHLTGRLKIEFSLMWTVSYMFDCTNSGTSVFVYYWMNYKYRNTCQDILTSSKT